MKKQLEIDDEDWKFLKDYKESHGVSAQKYITIALREKIVKTIIELKLKENATDKR